MRAVTNEEFALLDEILRTGDFHAYGADCTDNHPQWVLFESLEERGYVGWYAGPLTREVHETPECSDYLDEGPFDPCLTQLGHMAVLCWKAAHQPAC